MALPPLVVELMMNSKEFTAKMKEADASLTKLGNHPGLKKFSQLGKATLTTATAVGVGVAGASIKMAGDFQKSMETLVTAGGESQSALKTVSGGIIKIARDTGTSTSQLAEGMYVMEKAGIRGADGLKVLKAAAEGAKAENTDLGTMTNALTSIMRSYNIPAKDAVKVTNELVAGSGAAKTSMQEYAGSLSTVLPIASAAHISFAQVAGAIATLTSHGTSAQESTQELANTIRNLQAPNNVAIKEMAQFGISSNDVSTKLGQRGLTGTLTMLSDTVLKKMGPSGTVLLNSFNQSKTAAADANTMLSKMPGSVQKVAKAYESGKLSLKNWRNDLKAMPADQAALASQWSTTENQAKGFNQQLRNGTPAAQTYTAAMKQMLGGSTGLNTALMLTGGSASTFTRNVKDVASAGKKTGQDISTWSQTQKLFNTQLDKAKQYVETYAIELGTKLIPYAENAAGKIKDLVGWFQKHTGVAKALATVVGGVLVASIVAYVGALAKAHAASIGWGTAISGIILLIENWKRVWAWIKDAPAWEKALIAVAAGIAAVKLALSGMSAGAGVIDGIVGGIKNFGKGAGEAAPAVGGLAGKVPTLFGALKGIAKIVPGIGTMLGATGLAAGALGAGVLVAAGGLAFLGYKFATAKSSNEQFYESMQKQYKATGNNYNGYLRLNTVVDAQRKKAQTLSNVYGQELQMSTQGAGQASTGLVQRLSKTKIALDNTAYAAQKNGAKLNTLNWNSIKLGAAFGISQTDALHLADSLKIDLSKGLDLSSPKVQALMQKVQDSHSPTVQLAQDVSVAGSAFATASDQATAMSNALGILSGKNIDAAQANLAFKQQVGDLSATLKTNKNQLGINTKAGRDNQTAILSAGSAALASAQAYQAQGHSSKQTATYLKGLEGQLERTLVKQTGNKKAVDKLLGSMGLLPAQAAKAFGALDSHTDTSKRKLDLLAHGYNISIAANAKWSANQAVAPGGGLRKNAAGGLIRGPGTGTSDSIMSLVSNGEYVNTAKTVNRESPAAFDALNSGKATIVPKFASGGLISISETDNIGTLATQASSWLNSNLTSLAKTVSKQMASAGNINYKAGAGVSQWASLILKALAMEGQPSSLLGTVERRMNQESGGNPNAINRTDINAQRGDPSRGLMQTIMSTFRAYHYPGTSNNIYDPFANILASMGYAISRYGSLSAAYNRAGGYDSGGWLMPGVTKTTNATGKPEAVFTDSQWSILKNLVSSFSVNNSPTEQKGILSRILSTIDKEFKKGKGRTAAHSFASKEYTAVADGQKRQLSAIWSLEKKLVGSQSPSQLKQTMDHALAHANTFSGSIRDSLRSHASTLYHHALHVEQTQNRSREISTYDYAKSKARGITGTTSLAGIKSILDAITARVDKIKGPDKATLVALMQRDNAKFTTLANERFAIGQKIAAANSMVASVKASTVSGAAITGLDLTNQVGGKAGHPGYYIVAQLAAKLKNIKTFSANLSALAKKGLSNTLLQQMMDAGVDGGADMAAELMKMRLPDLKQLNSIESQIGTASGHLGRQSANLELGGNINKDYIGTLQNQQKAVETSITNLAKAFVKEMGKGLHIKTYDVGGWLMPGLTHAVNGLGKREAIMPEDVMRDNINDAIRANGGGSGTVIVQMPDIYLDGDVIYKGVQARAIRAEKRNGNNGLSRRR